MMTYFCPLSCTATVSEQLAYNFTSLKRDDRNVAWSAQRNYTLRPTASDIGKQSVYSTHFQAKLTADHRLVAWCSW